MHWPGYVLVSVRALRPRQQFCAGPIGDGRNARWGVISVLHMCCKAQSLACKHLGWLPNSAVAIEPENPERPLCCLHEYSPRAWVGGRMCVTHACGLAGAAEVGLQKLCACRHVQQSPAPCVGSVAWSIRLGCISGVPKILRGGAAMGKSAMPGVPSWFGIPPTPCS